MPDNGIVDAPRLTQHHGVHVVPEPGRVCVDDPDRWITTIDEQAKAACLHCPRRWLCAREACEMPRAEGMWAGVVIPEAGRGRAHALRRLRSLAERGGYPVRQPAWRSS
jgi:WhiB family transcriptional regulator, redox-sensing transcriptional regulator